MDLLIKTIESSLNYIVSEIFLKENLSPKDHKENLLHTCPVLKFLLDQIALNTTANDFFMKDLLLIGLRYLKVS